ncbi:epoxyqueuosine reductase [Methanofollis aquaemaris]|uniref:Epoxyqueuosine reductase n=1 Tax=Methanofollis aquaemaris TaxID=126734 RepID=A0A8A3S1C9_9EURY|nr:4Fe-4S binding protein [Methanofollis aquaemaris]QSZ66082.1 epoxyqueuosine reductase [Methanofollis aquaemaris]
MHSGSSPLQKSRKSLEHLLHTEGVDLYATLAAAECSAPEGYHPRNLLPSAKTVIIFGLEIPTETFSLASREKTGRLHRVIGRLDEIAFLLVKALEDEGYRSIAVPSFFPVRVRDRRIMGYLSLKHLAAEAGMGSIGRNTLLITSRSGNRVALGAVVTEKELHVERPAVSPPRCRRCNRCIKACPTGALNEEGVDVLRCRNVTHAIPAPVRPLFGVLFESRAGAPLTEWLVNRMARDAEMVCSRCLTACPYFREGGGG